MKHGSSSFVPGAWHGGWAWHPVAERLRAAGHSAIALTMPGLNDGDDPSQVRLQDAIDHVVNEAVTRDLHNIGWRTAGAVIRCPARSTG